MAVEAVPPSARRALRIGRPSAPRLGVAAGPRALATLLAGLLILCHGCSPSSSPGSLVDPSSGPMSGYFSVRIDVSEVVEPDAVAWVRVGAVHGYDLTPDGDAHLLVTVQGHPTPGDVVVELGVGGETHTLGEVFRYEPSRIDGIAALHAIGASLTEGTQRGLPTPWSITHGPAAQLARQLGTYFPLPILIADGFQEMTPDLIGPPPYCQPPPLDAYQMQQALDLIPQLTDPETGEFSYALVRVDPTLTTHNVAVGGSRVRETLDGPADDDIALTFLSHMVYEPSGTLGDAVSQSQMERLESASPDLVVSFDLLGNDLIDGMIDDADFSLSQMTPLDVFLTDIEQAVDRLAATGAQVFLATLPNPAMLPFFRAKRARLARDGLTDNADLVFDAIETGAAEANARLVEKAAGYDDVHVVDIAAMVATWTESGVQVGHETLWVAQYGGLVGLDGLHFTDTAYALLANAFIERMADELDTEIPPIDVAAVWAVDRERPDQLLAAGLDSAACENFP